VVLEREVAGLRETVGRLERGEAILPPDDVLVSVSDRLLGDLLNAQLPLAIEAGEFELRLERADVAFRNSPLVTLSGGAFRRGARVADAPGLGALEGIAIDSESGTLGARLAIDHLDLLRVHGLESLLPAGATDELARSLRERLQARIPRVDIPIEIERRIVLPPVSEGPVRLRGATIPLDVAVEDVYTSTGDLWIALKVAPGAAPKTLGGPERP
jgi:hypothetical protein